jgi:hypothetical protein
MPHDTNNLRRAVADLRAASFPEAPLDEHGSDLHARLAEFDGYAQGLLARVAAGEKQLAFPFRADPVLRQSIEHLRDRSEGDTRDKASCLLAYLAVLERAIRAAQSELASD